ncbi:LruC domain-containing protein [Moritella sp.]|uniref:LruC domain-containing protein n=1 Tax=Moritella sp. TaxID=78556 RepID=UPI001DFDEAE0|nr:LruC domain-containing protein [Moritella sp.]MCJ8350437.1 LruC domain-containing protein [Moritella sp.]NQZ40131.1 LruC domain-containing protein [Moritella sp.]
MHTFKLNKLCCLGLFALSSSVLSTSVLAAATAEGTVDHGDGTFTYTQKIDVSSTAPHYTPPASGGFNIYSGYDEDYGWQHSFLDITTNPLIQIQSATLLIRGYDIDSESFWGTAGEYDGISVDGVDLNPGLLQGANNTWSETTFDVPISSISDDGLVNTFLDINMNYGPGVSGWMTTLDYSLLTITYMEINNSPPYKPELSMSPSSCDATTDSDLVVSVTGPTPADPDGDTVSYLYRWFVDIGQGSVVDDEVAGKTDHQGDTVLSSQTVDGETWRAQVTAVDSNGLMSDPEFSTWTSISTDCDGDGVDDVYDDYPTDPERAFNNYDPEGTLAYEDLWPDKGDYDFNDFVLYHTFNKITNGAGNIKEIEMVGSAVARGASYPNAFAISLPGTEAANIESSTVTIDGSASALVPETGHTGEAVMVLIGNVFDVLPAGGFPYYNTQDGDERPFISLAFNAVFETPVTVAALGDAPYNAFIYRVGERGKEIHLMDKMPSDLADLSLLGTADDASDAGSSTYYQTATGHPWALLLPSTWSHPFEYVDILIAYPQLQVWAESGGVTNPTWYNFPDNTFCWKCL